MKTLFTALILSLLSYTAFAASVGIESDHLGKCGGSAMLHQSGDGRYHLEVESKRCDQLRIVIDGQSVKEYRLQPSGGDAGFKGVFTWGNTATQAYRDGKKVRIDVASSAAGQRLSRSISFVHAQIPTNWNYEVAIDGNCYLFDQADRPLAQVNKQLCHSKTRNLPDRWFYDGAGTCNLYNEGHFVANAANFCR